MFSTLIVVMVSWVHTYVQTDQDVYFECAQYFVYQLCLNKAKYILHSGQIWKGKVIINSFKDESQKIHKLVLF